MTVPFRFFGRYAFGRRAILGLAALLAATMAAPTSYAQTAYRSPLNLAFAPDGSRLAVADPTWGGVVILNPQSRAVLFEVPLQGDPSYVVWNGNGKVLVSEGKVGSIAEVNVADGTVIRRLGATKRAAGVAITSDRKTLLVCDRALNAVVSVDLERWSVASRVDVVREPGYIALTSDDRYAVVANKLPRSEDARLTEHAAEVSIIDLASGIARNVRLPGGSSIVRQIAIPRDNPRYAYVIHQLGRANTMVTQLDRGWVMTNATSIIDIAEASLTTSFLFDKVGLGAANPWGVAVAPDGSKLWATLAGMSELATVDLRGVHQLIAADETIRNQLAHDLSTMNDKGFLQRRPLSDVEGTRGVALSPDGKTLAVAAYFEGKVFLVDVASDKTDAISLGKNDEDQIRKGERLYNSGKTCYQHWLSCATCHEGGRMDGLNWDLMNDGQGNPKNVRSHMLSSLTPPTNITGCRENAMVSARAGYKNIEFLEASEPDVVAPTYAYIQALTPEPSPYLASDGRLTADALEGKKLFESSEVGCSGCHLPPLFTDQKRHNVGTRIPSQDIGSWDEGGYDTPTLVEVWRTAPYLHLGNALTVREVFTTFNPHDEHGTTSQLTPQQLDQLAIYVMQIGPTAEGSTVTPDAGTSPITDKTDPTETTESKSESGCICRLGVAPGSRTRGLPGLTIVVGAALLMLTLGRRRRASRSGLTKLANGSQSVKGQWNETHL